MTSNWITYGEVRNCFIRGSVVRYVQLPPEGVDIELLHDATRREARGG
nr:sm-like protein LSM2 [Ipomoea batatas]GMD25047.1 sm-like protein LSM2 [Ipomoea batatas]